MRPPGLPTAGRCRPLEAMVDSIACESLDRARTLGIRHGYNDLPVPSLTLVGPPTLYKTHHSGSPLPETSTLPQGMAAVRWRGSSTLGGALSCHTDGSRCRDRSKSLNCKE